MRPNLVQTSVLSLIALPLAASPLPPTAQVHYRSLDPLSVAQHAAFYELYPDSEEGRRALLRAWALLRGTQAEEPESEPPPAVDLQVMLSFITRLSGDERIALSERQLAEVEKLGSSLSNRALKGAHIWKREELLALREEEIDLARALLLYQSEEPLPIRQYEASLDLMALQIRARLPSAPTPRDKIQAINRYIFEEMQFRFPPHSLWIKDIDVYTFLPSVLDSRQGVCLGVSVLYLALAQRLDLPLEIITPPGHIYVRYRDERELINIETTARGIDLPSETYLGISTHSLPKRTLREVVGLVAMNHASVAWEREEYERAVLLYEQALPYLPQDPLFKMLLGINYLFVGRVEEGRQLLKAVAGTPFPWAVAAESIPEDLLQKRIDVESLKAIFRSVDATRSSILKKQEELKGIVQRYPRFRAGLLHLATTYLQLNRGKEAEEALLAYHRVDPGDPTVDYYLAVLSLQRYRYARAWDFFRQTEALLAAVDHHPRALRELKLALKRVAARPEAEAGSRSS